MAADPQPVKLRRVNFGGQLLRLHPSKGPLLECGSYATTLTTLVVYVTRPDRTT